jgi:hypothetical protein
MSPRQYVRAAREAGSIVTLGMLGLPPGGCCAAFAAIVVL